MSQTAIFLVLLSASIHVGWNFLTKTSFRVSYIVALRQSSVLMAVLAGGIGLREPSGRWRFLGASVMLVGFYLVATAQ